MDHTYEVPVVFPGGRLVLPTLGERPRDEERAVAVRLPDARFVLAQLPRLGRRSPLSGRLDLRRVAMIGHSMGGATAASLMLANMGVRAGVDMDGSLRGRVNAGLDRPFMLMLGGSHVGDATLSQFVRTQRGSLVRTTSAGVAHVGFTDRINLVPQLARRAPAVRKTIPVGNAPSGRALTAERAYLRAFLDTYLRKRPSPLLRKGAKELPGVQVFSRSPKSRPGRG
jgi:dienelactone hydrolase